jgi:hypothetical protein
MTKQKQIFLIYECDAWKSWDSMKLILCTTSKRKVKSFIANKILQNDFDYDDYNLSRNQQVKKFKKDFEIETRRTINDKLKYCYYDYCYDGKEI